jgi:hypothetical protein
VFIGIGSYFIYASFPKGGEGMTKRELFKWLIFAWTVLVFALYILWVMLPKLSESLKWNL